MSAVISRQKWPLYIFLLVVGVSLLVGWLFLLTQRESATIYIGEHTFHAQVVRSQAARAKGLSGRSSLAADEAMVFVAEKNRQQKIWMKDMDFPIDVVWLDDAHHIVHREIALQPDSFPKTFGPSRPTRYVIEFPAHTTALTELENGDILSLTLRGGAK